MSTSRRFCDRLPRRDFLRVGAASALGMNFGLPGMLKASPGSEKSLIFLFLQGGLSTIDTLDMKLEAPMEVRGEFRSIPTNVPGIHVGEHLPLMAKQMDKMSLLRSFTHSDNSHGSGDHYMLTGYHTLPGFNGNLKPNNQRPSHGSVIARQLGSRGSVPPYVCLPKMHPSCGASYLGASAAPFVIDADPSAPDFEVPDLFPPMTVDSARLEARQELLGAVDRFHRAGEAAANRHAQAVSVYQEKAFGLMVSPESKKAFDISREPAALRDTYGRDGLGQSCLMARRLVEAGVRCVTINHANWDTHSANFTVLRDLLPRLDRAVAALFQDLADRGMLESTLVVVTGEFGRTPKINKDAGRDHWSKVFTVAVGGGGLQGGRVIGKSDAWAAEPAEDPVSPEDLAATIHTQLGIDPNHELITPEGRPIAIVNGGRVIRGLL